MKYIVITGGVMSGIGKGITASSIGVLLKFYGFSVTSIKIDPYLNIDAGTMSPFEHGECYILDDGTECDLDLGNYERFLNITLTGNHNITTGKIYKRVINFERSGEYLGQTVQIIPHVTDAIKEWIINTAQLSVDENGNVPDICIIELGGTIGDIESMPFIESLSQLAHKNPNNMCFVHLSYVPQLKTHDGKSVESKSKPTQNSVKELRRLGITPDIICVRSEHELSENILTKISNHCHISQDNVFPTPNKKNIYLIPLLFQKQNMFTVIDQKLTLSRSVLIPFIEEWQEYVYNLDSVVRDQSKKQIKVAIVGKYTGLLDSYLSLIHAIKHAGFFLDIDPEIIFINSQQIDKTTINIKLCDVDAIIIPGGFGIRGIEGMLITAEYSRINKIPLLGICLGMQVQAIEIGRKLFNQKCDSVEFNPNTRYPIISAINDDTKSNGETMKLGSHKTILHESKSKKLYIKYGNVIGTDTIHERHRHRYEFNPGYVVPYMENGVIMAGMNKCGNIPDIIEVQHHPFYVGCQFHPEYLSRHDRPHPLFIGLIQVAKNNLTK